MTNSWPRWELLGTSKNSGRNSGRPCLKKQEVKIMGMEAEKMCSKVGQLCGIPVQQVLFLKNKQRKEEKRKLLKIQCCNVGTLIVAL